MRRHSMLQNFEEKDDNDASEVGSNSSIPGPTGSPLHISNLIEVMPVQTLPNQLENPPQNELLLPLQNRYPTHPVHPPYPRNIQHPRSPQHMVNVPQNMQFMGPPQVKQELNYAVAPKFQAGNDYINYMNSNIPQSLTDILSWLFTDSPPDAVPRPDPNRQMDPRMMSPYSQVSADPRISQILQSPLHGQFSQRNDMSSLQLIPDDSRHGYQEDVSFTPFYHNSMADSVMNVGLQDLNFFLNSDNPLDQVFRPQADTTNPLADSGLPASLNWNLASTASSSSPTNTSDSLTPKAIGEYSPQSEILDAESMAKRLEMHALKNVAKNKRFFVDSLTLNLIINAIPNVTREQVQAIFPDTNDKCTLEDRISFYLYGYWEVFHPRFSILHKPSFSTKSCQPLLLLSMLLIGCMYCATSQLDAVHQKKCPEFKVCILIAVPLRFTLFQHEDFKSPVQVWILQSLNLLEWCEKNYLLRGMHERAHIHHGTTVQLLRRSPFLGGNPTVANKVATSASDTNTSAGEDEASEASDADEDNTTDQTLFARWVESESMKRITFMTFYLDVIDYIKFRHNPQIPFFQLQLLNLPCDEEALWNSDEVNGSFRKIVKRQKKLQRSGHGVRAIKDPNHLRAGMNFLSALKRMMKLQKIGNTSHKLSMFTKNILFGGLVSIMHQMQQTELQNNFSLLMASDRTEKNRNQVWKEVLTKVLDAWETDVYSHHGATSSDPFFNTNKGQCKYPMYHLAQIIGMADINHYDIAIFGGSPGNMSVEATSKDLAIVQRKLNTIWMRNLKNLHKSVNDLVNLKSVVHCYWLLWGMMLSPLGEDGNPVGPQFMYDWRVDHDYYDGMYAVSIATLVLWCYVYSMCGVESSTFKDLEATMLLEDLRKYEKISELCAEDGYQYLFRIRQEFTQRLKNEGILEDYILHSSKSRSHKIPMYDVVSKYCDMLPLIASKQNISGLCFLVGTKLLKSQWQVIRENAKLIINCGLRSVGKKNMYCSDLFDNEFED